ncbi:MAG: choice-of-anchor J domain-containing protein, partial [Bacteroidota bacterium]|nr:choice-of-anchor J domain-containing protein [Bacteroidota bacterium]
PTDNANEITTSFTASITFNENVFKGTGNIILKGAAGSVINSFDVTASDVRVSGATVNFNVQGLSYNSSFYFEITPGAFIDGSDNDFAGITDAVTWNFSTATVPPVGFINNTYSFNECSNNLQDGFTQYSEEGSVIWSCTTFGRDATNPPSGNAPNGLQINGFVNGANQINTDWLISPAFDLTSTNYPILSFWSRTAFTGSPLKLLVSTNYNGSGDPKLATWTELNGKFPGTASDVWTLSDNINLTKYKGGSVYIAFVYFSSSDDGARWTLDDINIRNDNNPPAPSLTVLTNDVQFIYVKGGETAVKEISFAGNDLVEDVMVTATSDFLVSKDGENFASSVTFNVAEANDVFSKLYIQFAPALENQNYSGTVTLSTSEAIATINIQGSSIDPAITLEVVNWNIEWFGSTLNGPRNEELQEQNVVKIMKEVNADVYGLMEIVDEAKLARVVNQLEGYAYTISDFGSHVNPFSGTNSTLEEAQKLAFVYKTSVVSVNEVRPMLSFDLNTQADAKDNPNFYSWSSGRYPYLMDADVTLGGITKNIKFVLVHAKANTAPLAQSYERRKAGADALYDSLKTLWPEQEIIMLGDFNDDLDVSITTGYTTTSWNKFTEDLAEYDALTLPLSLAGKKSTVSYNDIIDHVVVSNEMNRWYMTSTANILTEVTGLVTNYGGTTSDHYPVFSRYIYCSITAPENIVVSNDEGQCGAVVNYSFTNTQTCGTVTADIESGTFFSMGTHTVTLTSSYGDIATFIITVEDSEKPVISLCPTVPVQCYNSNNNYTIPVLIASDNCGIESLDFTISGATTRSGNGNNASGIFNIGTSTITWKITDVNGNQSSCQTTVIINSPVTSSIPDAYAIKPGSNPNTVYIGYQPASSITLNATVTGGTSPYNYKWTIGSSSGRGFSNATSVTVNPTTTSTYYLNVEDAYRCVADATTKTINVIDVRCGPKMDKVSVCQNVKGKWTTSCVQSKDVAGLLANGATLGSCSTTPSSVVTFAEPVMEQAAKGLHVLAMPNPSSGYFNIRIQSENNSERIFVRITDLLGRTVEQFQNIPSTHVLRIGDNYKNGVYLVEVIQGSSKKHLKIIKNQ